jgi:hypothetical protein
MASPLANKKLPSANAHRAVLRKKEEEMGKRTVKPINRLANHFHSRGEA